jgi:antirestriction protein
MTNTHHNVRNNTEASSNGEYFAQPYALDGKGFYFDSIESYTTQATAHSCEEFELQYIDGDLAELFRACDVNQTTIGLWFDQVLDLHDHEQACLFYRCDDLGEDIETALANLDDTYISEGSPEDYARDLIDDCGTLDSMPEHLRFYFDYAAYARDMVLNGDVTAFTYNGSDYVASR